ncbi:MAG: threonylcarbamoyl-AMP synthase [Myxococcales bacterium]|nr:threonylcarbamoyl-AMP synthase [Myxococcales bacterium]
MPRVIRVDPEAPDASVIEEAAAILRAGGLVAMPTETVYGLAARALDARALAKIFEAKGRPATHPLIAHVADARGAAALARDWPDHATALASRFFPGPLTLVVSRADHVPLELTGGGATVAVRSPDHAVARALLAAVGEPLAAPSANRYQTPSPTSAAHVVRSLGERVDLVLDAGTTRHGIESTVVDLTSSPPRLLRPGALSVLELRTVLAELVVEESVVAGEGTRASPGMDARHYAPRARLGVLAPEQVWAAVELLRDEGARLVVLTRGAPPASVRGATVVAMPDDAVGYAAALFGALHDADAAGADVLLVEAVPDDDAWLAVRDRLRRAQA